MNFLEKLDFLMNEQSINKSGLSQISGVPYTTIDGFYKKGYENTKLSTIRKISKALNVSLDYLIDENDTTHPNKKAPSISDEADEIADVYRKLDDHGKGAVKAILNFEHASAVAEKRQSSASARPDLKVIKRSDGFIEVKVYDQPAAAGLGNYLDDPDFHMEQYPANQVPDGTEFGIKISGYSMAPNIPDGCTAFVQSRSTIEPGKIGIFLLNGEARCKKLMVDKNREQIRLVSFNPEFEDRIIEECDDFRTFGLVLGWWPHG